MCWLNVTGSPGAAVSCAAATGATNNNVVLTQNQTFGTSLGQPLSILQPRVLRLSAQMRF